MIFGEELALLLFIRSWRADFYKQFIRGELDPKIIISELRNLPNSEQFFTKHISIVIESLLIASAQSMNVNSELLEEYNRVINDENESNEIIDRAKRIVDIVGILWRRFEGRVNLKFTSSRIEFSDSVLVQPKMEFVPFN